MLKQAFCTLIIFLSFNLFASNPAEDAIRYIEEYKDIAIREMERSGIPASIKMAQAIHESSWGRGKLAMNSNNFFGIKCKEEWTGATVYHKDDDYDRNGNLMKSCFRAYNSIDESFEDHTNFLLNNSRYQNLFQLDRSDYVGWAKGLKASGYATDPRYAEKLIRTIREHHLYELDQTVDMNQLLVQVPAVTFPSVQDTVVPVEPEEENYVVPAAVRLPDDYVRNSYTRTIDPANVVPLPQSMPTTETNDFSTEPAAAFAPEYEPTPAVEPAPTAATTPVEQTTARQAPAMQHMEASRAAITAPVYRLNPELTNKGGMNRSNKRKQQTLQKSRTPRPGNIYRRR